MFQNSNGIKAVANPAFRSRRMHRLVGAYHAVKSTQLTPELRQAKALPVTRAETNQAFAFRNVAGKA